MPLFCFCTDDTEEDHSSCQGGFKHFKAPAGVQSDAVDRDAEVVRRAQDEGCVNVVFPGSVTQEGCCRFVSEILKCILYQRQQLPMTYDQLVYSQRKRQASAQVNRRSYGTRLHLFALAETLVI